MICEHLSPGICGKRKPRSACAFEQPYQDPCCPQTESLDTTEDSLERRAKAWMRLCACARDYMGRVKRKKCLRGCARLYGPRQAKKVSSSMRAIIWATSNEKSVCARLYGPRQAKKVYARNYMDRVKREKCMRAIIWAASSEKSVFEHARDYMGRVKRKKCMRAIIWTASSEKKCMRAIIWAASSEKSVCARLYGPRQAKKSVCARLYGPRQAKKVSSSMRACSKTLFSLDAAHIISLKNWALSIRPYADSGL